MKKRLLLIFLFFAIPTVNAQFFEGFENTTGPDPLPSTNWTLGSGNWAVFDNGVGLGMRWGITNLVAVPPLVIEGQNAAYIRQEDIGQGNTSEDYLATPAITIPTNGVLSFHSRTSTPNDQGTIFQIKVASASLDQSNPASYTLVEEFTEDTVNNFYYEYGEKFVDLSAYAGTSVYIAFVRKFTQPSTTIGGDRWLLDLVSVQEGNSCLINNSCSNYIQLKPFVDLNNNGLMDADEFYFPHGNFVYQTNNSGVNQYLSSNYYCTIFNPDFTTSYDIQYYVNSEYAPYFSCNTSYTNFVANFGSNTLYFPIVPTNPFNDAGTYIINLNRPRPGFIYKLRLYYYSTGFVVTPSGTLTFTKDPNLSIVNISEPGAVITPSGFTLNLSNLVPFTITTINVDLAVPNLPAVSLGQLVTNSAAIQVANDMIPENNNYTSSKNISGAYDPNDISEAHGESIVFDDFDSNDYLTYTIRFENTGTANAEFVRINDLLDSQLDENTFQLLSASHDVNANRSGNQLVFDFNQINLPPSSSDNETGKGFVQFKIKPKAGYAVGDVIPNTASIYFDFNPAIVTNTFTTEFVQSLGTTKFDAETIQIYPNPANQVITITNSNLSQPIASIGIYDIMGKEIYIKKDFSMTSTNIDVSGFAKGVYFVRFVTANNQKIIKKLQLK